MRSSRRTLAHGVSPALTWKIERLKPTERKLMGVTNLDFRNQQTVPT
ncbi:hypothetical protein V5E97_33680 [Singulisphaera sp. Ch08]|uniref:Uncharacterized protein n=1 Tax=Singulisphaera sp. Ch08 TaxID=3120278 RepID=A0AAU7CDH5_9BACT